MVQRQRLGHRPRKTGLIHFTRSRKHGNPSITNDPWGGEIEPVGRKQPFKWLGVLWDRRLTFSHHTRTAARRGRAAANALKMLGGCYRGAPAHLLLNAAR